MKLSIPILLLSCLSLALSCKKSKNNNPDNSAIGSARLHTVIYNEGNGQLSKYRLTYNTQLDIDSIIETDIYPGDSAQKIDKYLYFSGYYLIIENGIYPQPYNDTPYKVVLNPNNEILYIYYTDLARFDVVYNAKNEVTSDGMNIYKWNSEGDIDTLSSGINTGAFTYDKSKPGQIGDGLRIWQFLKYGRTYANTVDLAISQTEIDHSGFATTYNYSYQFDALGRITSTYYVPGLKDTFRCTYEYY